MSPITKKSRVQDKLAMVEMTAASGVWGEERNDGEDSVNHRSEVLLLLYIFAVLWIRVLRAQQVEMDRGPSRKRTGVPSWDLCRLVWVPVWAGMLVPVLGYPSVEASSDLFIWKWSPRFVDPIYAFISPLLCPFLQQLNKIRWFAHICNY